MSAAKGRSTAKTQVLSCRCIVRTYDGKVVVANATCGHHRVHPDFVAANRGGNRMATWSDVG